jgi:hypothetical protein
VNPDRIAADHHRYLAKMYRRSAHWCFRVGLIGAGKDDIRQALRAWRNLRIYLGRLAS